jgi:putative heme-binding domain-containing protein
VQWEALYTLGSLADAGKPEVWLPWLNHASKPLATVALRALQQRERTPEFVNAVWPAAREAACRTPALAEEARFTFRQLGIAEAQLAELPRTPAPPTDKGQLAQTVIARMKGAAPALGRLSFTTARKMCAACHSVRPGELRLGPSLAGLGAAVPPQYLIESILEPNKVIKTGFQLETVETKDGRTFSGLVEAAGANLLIRMLGAPPASVALAEVKLRTASPISPMPAGLETTMTVAELADLTAYLLSLKGRN